MKNPPAVFARQANIAHGPQQVNNGVSLHTGRGPRMKIHKIEPNKLLKAHGERMDERAACQAVAGDPALAPLGTIDRAAHHER